MKLWMSAAAALCAASAVAGAPAEKWPEVRALFEESLTADRDRRSVISRELMWWHADRTAAFLRHAIEREQDAASLGKWLTCLHDPRRLPGILGVCRQGVRHPSMAIRRWAVDQLEHHRTDASVECLWAPATSDPDSRVRRRAIKAVGACGEAKELPRLVRLLETIASRGGPKRPRADGRESDQTTAVAPATMASERASLRTARAVCVAIWAIAGRGFGGLPSETRVGQDPSRPRHLLDWTRSDFTEYDPVKVKAFADRWRGEARRLVRAYREWARTRDLSRAQRGPLVLAGLPETIAMLDGPCASQALEALLINLEETPGRAMVWVWFSRDWCSASCAPELRKGAQRAAWSRWYSENERRLRWDTRTRRLTGHGDHPMLKASMRAR